MLDRNYLNAKRIEIHFSEIARDTKINLNVDKSMQIFQEKNVSCSNLLLSNFILKWWLKSYYDSRGKIHLKYIYSTSFDEPSSLGHRNNSQ